VDDFSDDEPEAAQEDHQEAPNAAACPVAVSLMSLARPPENDPGELLKNRFLCRGGGLLLVGPTGVGKSSLSMQIMIGLSLGKNVLGIEPARPLKTMKATLPSFETAPWLE
jgi:RecA-family ATPase